MEKSKVLIQFLLIFRQSGDALFFLYPVGFADILRQGPMSPLDFFSLMQTDELLLVRTIRAFLMIAKTSFLVLLVVFELIIILKLIQWLVYFSP